MAIAERELVVTPDEHAEGPTGDEIAENFKQLNEELTKLARPDEALADAPVLVTPRGDFRLKIPPSVFRMLRFVVHHMSRGDAISLMPVHMQLTTQEAANLLAVSRPFLIKLLDQGQMPYTRTGKHRRIKLRDVLDYKERRDQQALEMLAILAREAQEAGDYFG